MKKFAIVLSLLACAVCLFEGTSAAATNPFMDVPLNHWAYDAIGQLAARGVLSGYPDGTYKGKQPATRYEMASALARALAVVDMTKASKQDVEMLKKLVIEFKDELDALGVKVDQIDKRVAVLDGRLGGWKVSGELRLDFENWENDPGDGDIFVSKARLELHRWFGEDEGIYFYARIEDGGDGDDMSIHFNKFYMEVPVWWDMKMTVGRFGPDFESDYRFQILAFTDISNESWLTDRDVDGIQFQKSFGLGAVSFYAARPGNLAGLDPDNTFDMWELFGMAQLQFSERFGFDLGLQAFFGDDASEVDYVLPDGSDGKFKFDNLWTVFAGLRFNFNEALALKGLYFYQDSSSEYNDGIRWYDYDVFDSPSAFKAIIDVKQDLLKFTSLWLEYSQLDQGFYIPYGNVALTLVDSGNWNTRDGGAGFMIADTKIWRVGALQHWNDKFSSWLYVAGHTLENAGLSFDGHARDAELLQWGLGVEYFYKPNISFALNYINADWNDDAERVGYADEHRIQFRTGVSF